MKIRQFIIVTLCLVVFVSCGGRKKKLTGDGVLTKEELVAVLVDVHLLDATVATYNSLSPSNDIKLSPQNYDSAVFVHHECNDSIFRKSMKYYTLEGEIKDIYDDVIDSLNTLNMLMENSSK